VINWRLGSGSRRLGRCATGHRPDTRNGREQGGQGELADAQHHAEIFRKVRPHRPE